MAGDKRQTFGATFATLGFLFVLAGLVTVAYGGAVLWRATEVADGSRQNEIFEFGGIIAGIGGLVFVVGAVVAAIGVGTYVAGRAAQAGRLAAASSAGHSSGPETAL